MEEGKLFKSALKIDLEKLKRTSFISNGRFDPTKTSDFARKGAIEVSNEMHFIISPSSMLILKLMDEKVGFLEHFVHEYFKDYRGGMREQYTFLVNHLLKGDAIVFDNFLDRDFLFFVFEKAMGMKALVILESQMKQEISSKVTELKVDISEEQKEEIMEQVLLSELLEKKEN